MTRMPMMEDARAKTLAFVESLSDECLCAWPDVDFSPISWHLGHLAFTEAHWALKPLGDATLSVPYAERFAQNGRVKARRADGYERTELFAYMERVRERVREAWPRMGEHALGGDYLDWFLASHEHQHRETMALVLALGAGEEGIEEAAASAKALHCSPMTKSAFGGSAVLGTNAPNAYDNERPEHRVDMPDFQLSDGPVRSAEWAEFMADGGYETPALWCTEGWAFRQTLQRAMPRAWRRAGEHFVILRADGPTPLVGDEAVMGVSWYEASAYARWAGAALPTEDEWELAAQNGLAGTGQVWEWCACEFAPRPGFEAHPYRGYSEPYFDGKHRVMRGGSFATDPAIARTSFRNWFTPQTRQVFAGVRLRWP